MKKIALTQGLFATIDDEDWELVSKHRWHACWEGNTFYAVTKIRRADGSRASIRMHRLLLEARNGLDVDHCDGNGSNNVRANLRIATRSQNMRNCRRHADTASGMKGAYWDKNRRGWFSHIQVDGRLIYLGSFSTPDEAHAAYCAASVRYHGELGRTA